MNNFPGESFLYVELPPYFLSEKLEKYELRRVLTCY